MRPLCSQRTASGGACRKRAVAGSERCSQHLAEAGDQLAAVLRAGNYLFVACRAVGVSRRELGQWLRRGRSAEPGDEPFRELRRRLERASAEGEARNVAAIAAQAPASWQAAAWLLERQHPERWGRPARAVEEPAPAAPAADALDELAGRRAARRAGAQP